jgi:hypothetical protein
MNKRTTLVFVAVLFVIFQLKAQTDSAKVIIPPYDDKYSGFIKQLEAGQTDIDYKDFRESYIESQQFLNRHVMIFDSLQKLMYTLMDNKDYKGIVKVTKQMLSIDYTSMLAHKILRQTYKAMGDTVNAKKYHDIEFGLLRSILHTGDGKTCATGWHVIQIEEEYFILDMLGAKLKEQALDNTDGLCDEMHVKTDDGKKVYYFEITKVFEGYHKMGLK